MAKIIECASLCCLPGGRDTILATLDDEGFVLESMAPKRLATPMSVAAQSLYELSDPSVIIEPEVRVDLRSAHDEALDERRMRVSGAQWIEAPHVTIKTEGASVFGERATLPCAAADPLFIRGHREILEGVRIVVRDLVCEDTPEDHSLFWRIYGVDGMAPPPSDAVVPH